MNGIVLCSRLTLQTLELRASDLLCFLAVQLPQSLQYVRLYSALEGHECSRRSKPAITAGIFRCTACGTAGFNKTGRMQFILGKSGGLGRIRRVMLRVGGF